MRMMSTRQSGGSGGTLCASIATSSSSARNASGPVTASMRLNSMASLLGIEVDQRVSERGAVRKKTPINQADAFLDEVGQTADCLVAPLDGMAAGHAQRDDGVGERYDFLHRTLA